MTTTLDRTLHLSITRQGTHWAQCLESANMVQSISWTIKKEYIITSHSLPYATGIVQIQPLPTACIPDVLHFALSISQYVLLLKT